MAWPVPQNYRVHRIIKDAIERVDSMPALEFTPEQRECLVQPNVTIDRDTLLVLVAATEHLINMNQAPAEMKAAARTATRRLGIVPVNGRDNDPLG